MMPLVRLLRCRRGNAAVEMALVTPLLLILGLGAAELGNFFMDEHTLIKAVRDGARFAARQSFTYYTACSGSPDSTNVIAPTQNIVMYGYLSGSNVLTPNISTSDITVSTSCALTAGGQTMSGIYSGRKIGGSASGAQIVTVSATVPYRSVIDYLLGFSGSGKSLNATSQAVVTGI